MMNPDWRKIEFESRGLSIQSVCFLGEGWNSRVYLVNDELVFRFPKRTENWEELKREISFLAMAADNLPLAVPHYEDLFPDSLAAPYGYALYRYLRGRAMDFSALSDEDRMGAADRVATFLRALHGLQPAPELASLLPREDERTNAKEYLVRAEREIVPKLQPRQADALRQSFDRYLETSGNFSFVPVVLHADLSVDHLLMEDRAVVAAIDFGDINWGDPDYDLMYLFVDCGWTFVEKVAQRYGHRDLNALKCKLRHFSITDQIGTILDGPGRALDGQVDLAWKRLQNLLAGSESNLPIIGHSAAAARRRHDDKSQELRNRAEQLGGHPPGARTKPMDQVRYQSLRFEPLKEEHLETIYGWRCEPHVREFYQRQVPTWEEVREKHVQRLDPNWPTKCFLVALGSPIGYIQTYRISDWPEYAATIGEVAGICTDFFIGDPDYVGKGLAPLILVKFLNEVAFPRFPEEEFCWMGIDKLNHRALGAAKAAGFDCLRDFNEAGILHSLLVVTKGRIADRSSGARD